MSSQELEISLLESNQEEVNENGQLQEQNGNGQVITQQKVKKGKPRARKMQKEKVSRITRSSCVADNDNENDNESDVIFVGRKKTMKMRNPKIVKKIAKIRPPKKIQKIKLKKSKRNGVQSPQKEVKSGKVGEIQDLIKSWQKDLKKLIETSTEMAKQISTISFH